MRPIAEIVTAEVEREMETLTVKFALLVKAIPVEQRGLLIHQMIGAGSAMIGAGIASSSNPAEYRKEVEAHMNEIIDKVLAVHAAVSISVRSALQ